MVSAGEVVARRAQQMQKHQNNAEPASHTLGPARHHEEARGLPRAGPAEECASGPSVARFCGAGSVGVAHP